MTPINFQIFLKISVAVMFDIDDLALKAANDFFLNLHQIFFD